MQTAIASKDNRFFDKAAALSKTYKQKLVKTPPGSALLTSLTMVCV